MLLVPAAPAQSDVLATYLNWKAIVDVENGSRRCVITNNDSNHFVQIYYKENDDHLSVQVSNSAWNLPRGQAYRVSMQFDYNGVWTVPRGESGRYTDGTTFIDMNVSDGIQQWLKEFSESNRLTVTFKDAQPWVLSLGGTHVVVQPFLACVLVLLKDAE
jgi:hypothetical protein